MTDSIDKTTLITGREPALKRLWAHFEALQREPSRELSEDERQELERLRAHLRDMESQVLQLEEEIESFMQTHFPRTGRYYRVRQHHTRRHPEVVKTAICRDCGIQFSYQVYATGLTRERCPNCREDHRRLYLREYQRERRAREREERLADEDDNLLWDE